MQLYSAATGEYTQIAVSATSVDLNFTVSNKKRLFYKNQ